MAYATSHRQAGCGRDRAPEEPSARPDPAGSFLSKSKTACARAHSEDVGRARRACGCVYGLAVHSRITSVSAKHEGVRHRTSVTELIQTPLKDKRVAPKIPGTTSSPGGEMTAHISEKQPRACTYRRHRGSLGLHQHPLQMYGDSVENRAISHQSVHCGEDEAPAEPSVDQAPAG